MEIQSCTITESPTNPGMLDVCFTLTNGVSNKFSASRRVAMEIHSETERIIHKLQGPDENRTHGVIKA